MHGKNRYINIFALTIEEEETMSIESLLKAEIFGHDPKGGFVYCLRLQNINGMIVDVINYGATIKNILLPKGDDEYIDNPMEKLRLTLQNHTYFNLGGDSSGAKELFEHDVTLYADKYTPVNESNKLPTGIIEKVDGTPFDLRTKSKLGTVIPNCPGGDHAGFDHNYVFDSKDLKLTAKVSHPSGNKMECWTNQLGLQFYTGNHLGDDSTLKGKSGIPYEKYGGFCLEAQNFPDAINNDNFPSLIVDNHDCSESGSESWLFCARRKRQLGLCLTCFAPCSEASDIDYQSSS
ncbi:galM [Lepeophtheirus salmonis]|uniref:Galactose mutarotase n=1 Tax=Lepeophtheirus salmonis TaxID=72036 RepID=A0A7R8HBY6_LEPSM|nr:galM [Lepeophtheirus salmonis]CAF2979993.1 galM [Lepeophtheirus salmonis]